MQEWYPPSDDSDVGW